MKVAIFGLGYVGSTAAGCIASQGHTILGVDVSEAKVAALNEGRAPVYEPGLDDLIAAAHADGRVKAVTRLTDELDDADIAIVCVGTPSGVDGAHNMSYIAQVTRAIAAALKPDRKTPLTLAYRSTMRPGSCENIIWPIIQSHLGDAAERAVELVYNPEFLREATAIEDFFHQPKIVIGTLDSKPSAYMAKLNEGIDAPVFEVGLREAEITKFVDNSWHAVKITFANEIGRVCHNLGISAKQVHAIFKSATKLKLSAYYTRLGGAFGGSCLPKDVRALVDIISGTDRWHDTFLRRGTQVMPPAIFWGYCRRQHRTGNALRLRHPVTGDRGAAPQGRGLGRASRARCAQGLSAGRHLSAAGAITASG